MKSLLVIGGSGFFGKSILDAYQRGLLEPWGIRSICVLARNASRLQKSHPRLLGGSVKLLDCDIGSCHDLPKADYVIHAASSTDAASYILNPEIEKQNIQSGTYNYAKLAKQFHIDSKIVYCSSGAIYGQQSSEVPFLHEQLSDFSIESIASNKRVYAVAKQDAELAIQQLGIEGMSVSIARCFAFVGPYLPRYQHFAIGNFIADGLNGRAIKSTASHLVYRSYMYADDLVIWLMTIAASASKKSPVFNVGSDQSIEIHELASKIANYFGVPVSNASISCPNRVDRYIPDINKAKKELGLTLTVNLDQAIKLTVKEILNSKQ